MPMLASAAPALAQDARGAIDALRRSSRGC
jgi:hypothetical protein